jgi:Cell wall-active antibiotics response 4TMS YvqF
MNLPRLRVRHTVIPANAVRDSAGVLAVMSGVVRKGPWELPRKFRIASVMGSAEIDLREAVLAEGESHIEVFCLFGSVEITVPSGVEVVVDGDAFAGEFSHAPDPSVPTDPGAPRIVIHGSAYFGAVECDVRLAGESEGQAKKRIRLARRSG